MSSLLEGPFESSGKPLVVQLVRVVEFNILSPGHGHRPDITALADRA